MGARFSSVILLVLLTCGLASLSHGQTDDLETEKPITEAELLAEAHADSTAMVEFQGRELFEVGSVSIVGAQERAAQISAEILAMANPPIAGRRTCDWCGTTGSWPR